MLIIDDLGFDVPALSLLSLNLGALVRSALGYLSRVGDLLMNVFFIMITTFFLLMEAPYLPERAARILGPAPWPWTRLPG